MKKLLGLLLILFCFFLVPAAYAGTTKFMVLSDTQITAEANEKGDGLIMTPSMSKLQKGVEMINGMNADFVVFLGDNIDAPNKILVVVFAKIVNKLNKPAYVTVGNQDLSQLVGVDKGEYFRLLNKFSNNRVKDVPCVKRMSPDLVFFYMNGVNQFIGGMKGYFKEGELLWLDKELKKYKNDKVVILQHFPIEPPKDAEHLSTYKTEDYKKVLSRHKNVIAVISGHYRSENAVKIDDIMHISVPGYMASGSFNEVTIEEGRQKKYLIKIKTHQVE